jgi:ankyrin repeat protein
MEKKYLKYKLKYFKLKNKYNLKGGNIDKLINKLKNSKNPAANYLTILNEISKEEKEHILFYFCKKLDMDPIKQEKIIITLLQNGISPLIYDSDKKTPLFYLLFNSREQIALQLIEYVDIKFEDREKNIYLIIAVQKNLLKIVEKLLQMGADINYKDCNGHTSLFISISNNKLQMCNLLLDYTPDVNLTDLNGNTPLMIAVKQDLFFICKKLLLAGANINLKNKYGTSALIYALEKCKLKICELLLDNGVNPNIGIDINGNNPLLLVCKWNQYNLLQKMINKGVNLTYCNLNNETCLHMASRYCNTNAIIILFELMPHLFKIKQNMKHLNFLDVWGFENSNNNINNTIMPPEIDLLKLL